MEAIIIWLKSVFYSDAKFSALEKFVEYVEKYEAMSTEKIEELVVDGLKKEHAQFKILNHSYTTYEEVNFQKNYKDEFGDYWPGDRHFVDVSGPYVQKIKKSNRVKEIHFLSITWRIAGRVKRQKRIVYRITYSEKHQPRCTD